MTTSNFKLLVTQNNDNKGTPQTAESSQLQAGSTFKVPQGANRIRVMLNSQVLQGNEVIDGKKLRLKKSGQQLLIQAGDETLITLDDVNNNLLPEGDHWPAIEGAEAATTAAPAATNGTVVAASEEVTVAPLLPAPALAIPNAATLGLGAVGLGLAAGGGGGGGGGTTTSNGATSLNGTTLSLVNDTGSSATDKLINNSKPAILLSSLNGKAFAAGDKFEIVETVNGTATVVGTYTVQASDLSNGVWNGTTQSITLSSALSDGAHTLSARVYKSATQIGDSSSALSVTIDTSAPSFTKTSFDVNENTTSDTAVREINLASNEAVTFSNLTGADADKFTLTADGKLQFKNAPNYETPTDATQNNVYNVSVTATDTAGNTKTQELVINVQNVNEAPTIQTNLTATTLVKNQSFSLNLNPYFQDPDAGNLTGGSFTVTGLPAGLSYNATTQTISGSTTAAAGTYNVNVTFTDKGDASGANTLSVSQSFALFVQDTPISGNQINGIITAGPLVTGHGLSVIFYKADGVTFVNGTENASTATMDLNGVLGQFTLSVGTYTGVVVAKVVDKNAGVDFKNEANNQNIDLSAQLFAVGVVPQGTGSSTSSLTLNINPLTTIAGQLAGLSADTGTPSTALSTTTVNNANSATASAFGLSDITTTTPDTTNDSTTTSNAIGAVLAALSGVDSKGSQQATIDAFKAAITQNNATGSLSAAKQLELVEAAAAVQTSVGATNLVKTLSDALASKNGTTFTINTIDAGDNIINATEFASAITVGGNLPTGATAVTLKIAGAAAVQASVNTSTGTWSYTIPANSLGDDGAKNIEVNTTVNGQTFTAIRTFVVNAQDNAPTAISLGNVVTSLKENTDITTRIKVADINVLDDGLGSNTLTLTGADASRFEIDGNVLYLKASTQAADALNFESKPTYNVTVNASGGQTSGTVSTNYSLNLTDVNEAPTGKGTVPSTVALLNQSFRLDLSAYFEDQDAGGLQGGKYTIANLPTGLNIDIVTGVITGKPTSSFADQDVTVTFTDKGGLLTQQVFKLKVAAAPGVQSFTVADTSGDTSRGKADEDLTFTVTFTETIRVTGTLQAKFQVGTTELTANFEAATGGSTATSFAFTGAKVPAGENGTFTLVSLTSVGNGTATSTDNGAQFVAPTAKALSYTGYTVDNTAPAALTLSFNDTGSSNSDGVTRDGTFTVGNLETGARWQYSTDAGVNWTDGASTNTFVLAANTYLANSVRVRAIDAANNIGSETKIDKVITIDITAPAAPTVTEVDSNDLFDNLMNSVESVTTNFRVALPSTGSTAVVGDKVELLLGGVSFATAKTVTLTSTNIANGYVDFTVLKADLGADGAKALTAKITDTADNASSSISALSFTLDTTITAAPEGTHTVAISNDTGPNTTDRITKDGSVKVSVTLANSLTLATDETFQVSADGGTNWVKTTGTGTAWATEDNAVKLSDTGSITARIVDTAGNIRAVTLTNNNYNLDITAPIVTTSYTVNENTASDTTKREIALTTSISGENVVFSNLTGIDATLFTLSGNKLLLKDTINYESPNDNGGNRSYDLSVKATDQAGNETTQAITINVQNVNEAPTRKSTSTSAVSIDWSVSDAANFQLNLQDYFADVDAGDLANGTYSITSTTGLPSWLQLQNGKISRSTTGTAVAGIYPITVTFKDPGNLTVTETFNLQFVSGPAVQSFTVTDNTLDYGGTGTTNTAGKAGDALTFKVTFTESITVTGTLTATFVVDGKEVVATYTGSGGAAELTFITSTTVPAGANGNFTLTSLTGTAVNASNSPLTSLTNGNLIYTAYTVDNTAPNVPALALAFDNGSSATDGITNNGVVNVTGLEAGSRWQYSTDTGSNWSQLVDTSSEGNSFVLGVGQYVTGRVKVRVVDKAGNSSGSALNQNITIDTTAPTSPSVSLSADTGESLTDGVTSNGEFTVTFSQDTTDWRYSTELDTSGKPIWVVGQALVNGASSFKLPLDKTYEQGTIQVQAFDKAGNASGATYGQKITLDTAGPVVSALGLANDTGYVVNDGVTRDGTMTVKFSADTVKWKYTTDGGVSFSNFFTPAQILGSTELAGSFELPARSTPYAKENVKVYAYDLAGNPTVKSPQIDITVDRTAPTAPTVILVNDTGFNDSDWITSKGTIKVSGMEVGSQWQYSTNGGTSWSGLFYTNANGEGTFELLDSLAANQLKVRTIDKAGNESDVKTITRAITIDKSSPTLPLTGDLFSLSYTEKARAPGADPNTSAGNSVGETQSLTIQFDSPVYGFNTQTGPGATPLTSLGVFKVGNTAVSATWSGEDGGTTRTLTYTVAEGQNGQVTIDSAALKSILTNATTGLKDASGNVFTYAADFPAITGMPKVDTTAPTQDIKTALVLDSAQKQYVKLPALSAAALGGDLTLEAWVYAKGNQSDWARIFDFSSGIDGANSIWLGFKDGKIRFESSDAIGKSSVSTTSSFAVNSWQHVAVTVGSDGKAITIFINGNLAGTGTLTSSVTDVARGNNYIGKSSYSLDPYFNGRIADARVYNDERTQTEIKSDMTGAMSGDQLVMSYRFNGTANSSGGSISQSAELTSISIAPTFVNQVKLSADTGSSATDYITNTATQNLTGKYVGNLADDENIYVSVDGGATWLSNKATTDNATGTWSLNNVTLKTGTNTIVAKVVDNAGNESPYQASQTYTLAANSAAPVIDLDSTTDGFNSSASRRGELYLDGHFYNDINLNQGEVKPQKTSTNPIGVISTNTQFSFVSSQGLTLETWAKPFGTSDTKIANIFTFEDPSNVTIVRGAVYRLGKSFYWGELQSNGTYKPTLLAENAFTPDAWQHIAVQIAPGTSNSVVSLYVNGNLAGTVSLTDPDTTSLLWKSQNLVLGGRNWDLFDNSEVFMGSFMDTRVYNKARTVDQIRSDMGGALDVNDANLLNSYQFNGSLNADKNGVQAYNLGGSGGIQLRCADAPTSLNANGSVRVSNSTLKEITVKVFNMLDSTLYESSDLIYVGATAIKTVVATSPTTGKVTLFGKDWDYSWINDMTGSYANGATWANNAGTLKFTSGTSFTGEDAQALLNQLAYANAKGSDASSPNADRTFTITVTDIAGNVSTPVVSTVKVSASTPVVLDLNGDGVHTTAMAQGVMFDVNHSGQPVKTGWVDANDGLLARDLNHDGRIQNGSELFGNGTDTANGKATDGYAALRQFDLNADGVINAQDAVFNELLVWTDRNTDGVSDAGELHTLASLGIASLSLKALAGTQVDNGNTLGLVSSWTDTQGKTHAMADVWFNTTSLHDLVQQATGSQKVDLAKDSAANTVDLTLAQVLQTEQKLVVVKADANDVVRIDHAGWVNTGSTTVVDNHCYALWSNSTAHLLIDQNAKVQAVI